MTSSLTNYLRRFAAWLRIQSDRGASMVEYALLVALVAIIGAAGWAFVGNAISDTSNDVCGEIAAAQLESGNTQSDCADTVTPTP